MVWRKTMTETIPRRDGMVADDGGRMRCLPRWMDFLFLLPITEQ